MKLTVIAASTNWCLDHLKKSAQQHGLEFEFFDFETLQQAKNHKTWGDFVIWRKSSRKASKNTLLDRPSLFNYLLAKNKIIINLGQAQFPYIYNKYFQQQMVTNYIQQTKDIELVTIPTFKVDTKKRLLNLIEQKQLAWPLIEKPMYGAEGDAVRKISSIKEISSLDNNIYQNFIENAGDYRVICLGGKVLGCIKRKAPENDYRNNLSVGGSAEIVTDKKIIHQISAIALKIASLFNLSFCGVDVIYDTKNRQYLFMEVNTLVYWKGFQQITQINVADEIVKYCLQLSSRKKQNLEKSVKDYYFANYNYLHEKKFHFASRHQFWFKDNKSRSLIKDLKPEVLGNNKKDLEKIIQQSLKEENTKSNINEPELRSPYLNKYQLLNQYNKILFKVLFADTLYQADIRPTVKLYLNSDKLLELKNRLEKDQEALAILSTYALNYIYNLENYLYPQQTNCQFIDLPKYFTIALDQFDRNAKLRGKFNIHLYFYTHCIINESKFYSQSIKRHYDICLKMIKLAEQIIMKNYFKINLDNKMEFLVCCKLMSYTSPLFDTIYSEAKQSLSDMGNYLIDKLNYWVFMKNKNDLVQAEHRNILFLMAFGKSHQYL